MVSERVRYQRKAIGGGGDSWQREQAQGGGEQMVLGQAACPTAAAFPITIVMGWI